MDFDDDFCEKSEMVSTIPVLLESFEKNYNDVMKLSEDMLCQYPIPCITKLGELTKNEIMFILKHNFWKYLPTVERLTLLGILTDLVACSYSNREFFETFQRKSDRKAISVLLLKLNSHWCNVFADCVGEPDIKESHITSALKLLNESVIHLDSACKFFVRDAILSGEKTLNKMKEASFLKLTENVSLTSTTTSPWNSLRNTAETSNSHPVSVPRFGNEKENKTDVTVPCKSVTEYKDLSVQSEANKASVVKVDNKVNSEVNKPPLVSVDNRINKPVLQPKNSSNIQKSNLLRYFKKPQKPEEIKPPVNEESKENIEEDITKNVIPVLTIESNSELNKEVDVVFDLSNESPEKVKPVENSEDKLSNGKLNAFFILMKTSKKPKLENLQKKVQSPLLLKTA